MRRENEEKYRPAIAEIDHIETEINKESLNKLKAGKNFKVRP